MRRLILPFAFATVAAAALTGCGQKGVLFYPPPAAATPTKAQPSVPHPPATSPTDAPASASSSRSPFDPLIHQ
jgi:predicted small lipoprotein YifL